MSDVKLGTLIPPNSPRDAIHVAVACVKAGMRLIPGTPILLESGAAMQTAIRHKSIGIVDPFLDDTVEEGEHFWVLLNQNTVTGMRHHWSHPSFRDDIEKSTAPASEAWLRNFANNHFRGNYLVMMDMAKEGAICFGDTDYPEDESLEFFAHFNAVTQLNIQGGYFRCAC